ncbi:MAG: AMP-binding protein, partial [Verrucomicrobiota bacterium]
ILAQIARWNPTRTAASPAFLQQLASAATSGSLSGFRKIYTGGAPVFPPLLSSLQLLAPKAEVVAVFGSSEAEPIAHISHEALESYGAIADGSGLLVGAPVAEIAVRILPDNSGAPMGPFAKTDFELLALPPGSPGEIAVAGPHVLGSYLNGHGNQETKIAVDGTTWHRTGDAGYLDTQGRLWLLGRCAAKISDSRGCLYPFAVECAAQNVVYPRRCALVSVRGRRILAVESTSPLLDEERTQLASLLSWAELDEIRAIASIPVDKRHNAKVLYDELRTALLR